MINKLSIYPHPSFYLHSPPFGGVGGGFFLISNIVYKLTINRLFFYPYPSFICTPLPSEGLGEASLSLMCFQPVLTPSSISCQRNIQRIGILHLLNNNAFHLFTLFWEDGEVKFIMHLENHL